MDFYKKNYDNNFSINKLNKFPGAPGQMRKHAGLVRGPIICLHQDGWVYQCRTTSHLLLLTIAIIELSAWYFQEGGHAIRVPPVNSLFFQLGSRLCLSGKKEEELHEERQVRLSGFSSNLYARLQFSFRTVSKFSGFLCIALQFSLKFSSLWLLLYWGSRFWLLREAW